MNITRNNEHDKTMITSPKNAPNKVILSPINKTSKSSVSPFSYTTGDKKTLELSHKQMNESESVNPNVIVNATHNSPPDTDRGNSKQFDSTEI